MGKENHGNGEKKPLASLAFIGMQVGMLLDIVRVGRLAFASYDAFTSCTRAPGA